MNFRCSASNASLKTLNANHVRSTNRCSSNLRLHSPHRYRPWWVGTCTVQHYHHSPHVPTITHSTCANPSLIPQQSTIQTQCANQSNQTHTIELITHIHHRTHHQQHLYQQSLLHTIERIIDHIGCFIMMHLIVVKCIGRVRAVSEDEHRLVFGCARNNHHVLRPIKSSVFSAAL